MSQFLFDAPKAVSVAVAGSDRRFPVRRIFCVGRNYAAHVREMGFDPSREAPCYFTKSPAALLEAGGELAYPPATVDLHHEVELVAALGGEAFGIDRDDALSVVYGYAVGLDMTRRDLQVHARNSKGPWDVGKDFDGAAVIGPIRPAEDVGHPSSGRIRLDVNGKTHQDADLGQMIWSVPEIIADLSRYWRLMPGDLVYTGTPDGVGPVVEGDAIEASIEAVGEITLRIT